MDKITFNENPLYVDSSLNTKLKDLPITYKHVLDTRYRDLEEISIRQELFDFISGWDYGEPKENIFIVKLLERDGSANPRKCRCWDNGCPYCDGLGYRNNEKIIYGFIFDTKNNKLADVMGYKNTLGRTTEVSHNLITTFDIGIIDGDFIMKPALTDEGLLSFPLAYLDKYLVKHSVPQRLDEGRFEFNFCELVQVQ
jgi:hypothetical protein